MGGPTHSSETHLIEPARREAEKLAAVLGRPVPAPGSFPGYDLVREIHHGGQGVVYEAVQRSTQRSVAIKVLHRGSLASPSTRARFDREVQILGQFRHPNIVTIHDSGMVNERVYYVMDCIAGEPLDRYLDHKHHSIRQVLEMLVKICEAVNAAHLRGVIHRDLKPDNIRVDARGEPYILDFGLAKMPVGESEDAPGPHDVTQTGQFVGSLLWASPEQVEGGSYDIDVRADVYSLGVILYRLLTGAFPYPVTGSPRAVLDNILHREPARPSGVARNIDHELDTILLKCLCKDRARRYQNAGELAREIRRYLAGEPIEAKGDSAWYVLRKSLRRYRVPVGVAAGFVVLVAASTVWLSIMYRQAVESSRQANESRDESESVTGFLADMLASATPAELGRSVLVTEVLDASSRSIGEDFADRPRIEARLRHTIGTTYTSLGEYGAAESHLQKAFDIRCAVLGAEHPDTLHTMNALASLFTKQARYAEAENLCVEALELCRRVLDEHDPDVLTAINNLAVLYAKLDRHDEAEPLQVQAVALSLHVLGEAHPQRIWIMNNLGSLYMYTGRYEEAEPLCLRSLELSSRELGEAHEETLGSMNNLASLYMYMERYEEAEPLYLRALELSRDALGEEHPDTMRCRRNLGLLYCTVRRYVEAEPLFAQAVASERRAGNSDESLGLSLARHGRCLVGLERYEEAETALTEAHDTLVTVLGPTHERTIEAVLGLVELYDAWGEPEMADEYRALSSEPR